MIGLEQLLLVYLFVVGRSDVISQLFISFDYWQIGHVDVPDDYPTSERRRYHRPIGWCGCPGPLSRL
ncbi:hypothetical protein MHI57_13025 [Cytobacillus sp. FSL K6-0129]|uniref:hypothetical protein n=1 Tax=Cytobacillus sp. FSL K6-0129 TaxID=2921421 RepID=UPI0030FD0414